MKIEIGNRLIARFSRVLALICLFVGLQDAAHLLGVDMGSQNPVQVLGISSFVYLSGFVIARLFCAVGLWLNTSWGAVVLVGATATELVLIMVGSPNVSVSFLGFFVRLALLLGGVAILAFVQIKATDLINR